jgi:hypothetical protein
MELFIRTVTIYQTMSTQYRFVSTIVLITIWLLLLLVRPIPSMAQQPSTTNPLGLIECEDGGFSREFGGRHNLEPMDSIDMNTVIVGSIVKTIHVEKEVINCISVELRTGIIIDLSIYTEVVEQFPSNKYVMPKISFDVVTCYKFSNGSAILGCETYAPSTTLPAKGFFTDCFKPLNVAFPIEMDTVVNSSRFVKTVEAEKEVFACGNVADITIFTETFEDLLQGTSNKTIFSTTCEKQIEVPKVLGCKASPVKQL